MANLSDTTVQWAADRGISRSTLERAGVGSGTAGMPGAGKCEVIAFPYRRNGEIVNVKYRALAEKAFKQREGGELPPGSAQLRETRGRTGRSDAQARARRRR